MADWLGVDMNKRTPQMRFWRKVDTSGECWIWRGNVDRYGYGKFHLDGVAAIAHRVAFEWLIGPIPQGAHLDHLCRNKACVNPDHLDPVTDAENRRRARRSRARKPLARETHEDCCPNGHDYTPENTHEGAAGYRQCRICRRAKEARKRERRKARTQAVT